VGAAAPPAHDIPNDAPKAGETPALVQMGMIMFIDGISRHRMRK
jgi:hypothetical protein